MDETRVFSAPRQATSKVISWHDKNHGGNEDDAAMGGTAGWGRGRPERRSPGRAGEAVFWAEDLAPAEP